MSEPARDLPSSMGLEGERKGWAMGEELSAYQLSHMVSDVSDPDSHTSPGAVWLLRVAGDLPDLLERIAEGEPEGDAITELADSAVPIYTWERWRVFVDLGAWQVDDEGLCGEASDMTERAGVLLYLVASQLLYALLEDAREDAGEDDAGEDAD